MDYWSKSPNANLHRKYQILQVAIFTDKALVWNATHSDRYMLIVARGKITEHHTKVIVRRRTPQLQSDAILSRVHEAPPGRRTVQIVEDHGDPALGPPVEDSEETLVYGPADITRHVIVIQCILNHRFLIQTAPYDVAGKCLADIASHDIQLTLKLGFLNSVSGRPVALISSKSRVYLLKDDNPVGLVASRSVGFSKRTVLIGRYHTFDTIPGTEFKFNVTL